MDFLFPYSETKIKPYIKMAIQRIQLVNNKRGESVKLQKRSIAELLAECKEEKATIKVEHVIREDYRKEGYEILELMLELLQERIRLVTTSTDCPEDMKQTIVSVMWAADNIDIDELQEVKNQLLKKYGRKFFVKTTEDENIPVNPKLVEKLSYRKLESKLLLTYLNTIAGTYGVSWKPSVKLLEDLHNMDAPSQKPSAFESTIQESPPPEPQQSTPNNNYAEVAVAYQEAIAVDQLPKAQVVESQECEQPPLFQPMVCPVISSVESPCAPPISPPPSSVLPDDSIEALQARLAALNEPRLP